MTNIDSSIRIAGFAVAALLVTGSTYALGSYSNAKVAASFAAAEGRAAAQPSQAAVAPVRIDVVGKRTSPRTAS